MPDNELFAKVSRALVDASDDPTMSPKIGDRLVDDLGFDSLKIASLSIALEKEIGEVILLNDWIGAAASPSDLTVQSLLDYVSTTLS
jgi:acyl carrier protein